MTGLGIRTERRSWTFDDESRGAFLAGTGETVPVFCGILRRTDIFPEKSFWRFVKLDFAGAGWEKGKTVSKNLNLEGFFLGAENIREGGTPLVPQMRVFLNYFRHKPPYNLGAGNPLISFGFSATC